ncbi:MAG: hypothetical protein ACYSN9_00250 [Planctomycetota bacterium]|jgi:hypothetical protein
MEEPKKIMMAHGGGGRLMGDLIQKTIVPKFGDGESVHCVSRPTALSLNRCFLTAAILANLRFAAR